jgi:hypothetical protein
MHLKTESTCPLSTFASRLAVVDAACCKGDGDCDKNGPASCSLDCATELVPAYDDCRQTIDVNFDAADGKEDGVADIFKKVYDNCLAIDGATGKARLRDQAEQQLQTMIADGCDADTTGITLATAAAGQHGSRGGGKRRVQAKLSDMLFRTGGVDPVACSFANLDARFAAVGEACCDLHDPTDACDDAVTSRARAVRGSGGFTGTPLRLFSPPQSRLCAEFGRSLFPCNEW